MATKTAARRRTEAKVEYDAFMAACKSRQLLDRLTDKWVTLVISALSERDMRYSELSRRVAGVSQKMLTQTLRNLERDGLVTRTVTATVPVTVDYALTDLGGSLHTVVQHLKDWAEDNMDDVLAAREAHDRRTA
ncbi:winged helix-turn-helix transcriptional regulator [Luteipulveratus mongoliensis]|uniref:HxlR family transcriptional regulator n=1 Tax=Luteipulveratus mongoliensis TaxID=571913 RepID=A0A0K1JHG4_9MICO|nr:helix-turn-helix domain-containing protein [Luteipulveratus mongoliensis]AKU16030.1 HxlR family transcriptional regulator [Luteipulveratus mongoliensis]